jgi:hypothetical protein
VIYSYDIYWYEPLLLRSDLIKLRVDLKSSPVLIVGFKILLKIPSLSYVCIGPSFKGGGGELSQNNNIIISVISGGGVTEKGWIDLKRER